MVAAFALVLALLTALLATALLAALLREVRELRLAIAKLDRFSMPEPRARIVHRIDALDEAPPRSTILPPAMR